MPIVIISFLMYFLKCISLWVCLSFWWIKSMKRAVKNNLKIIYWFRKLQNKFELQAPPIYLSFQHEKKKKKNELISLVESVVICSIVSVETNLPMQGTYHRHSFSHNSGICPEEKEVIWPHISDGFKILFVWNPRIGLISWRVTPDMPMDREIESLNVKNEVKKKKIFSLFILSAETFCQCAGTAYIFNFWSIQVKQTCRFNAKTSTAHIRKKGKHFAANQQIHRSEKCPYSWSVGKKTWFIWWINLMVYMIQTAICYWLIGPSYPDVVILSQPGVAGIPMDLTQSPFVMSHR